jgi:hypothetical protein
LSRLVWQTLAHSLPGSPLEKPLRVLEIGAGAGAMFERMLSWDLLSQADYTALDKLPGNIAYANQYLPRWGRERGYRVSEVLKGWRFEKEDQNVTAEFVEMDLFDFIARQPPSGEKRGPWDLLVAHAFLDLVDIPSTLPLLLDLLVPGGLFYFTLNFDGATLLEPSLDPPLDDLIQALYHQTMDARTVGGRPCGDSRTGRRLFSHLSAAGAEILAAGSSDWVVFPTAGGYLRDEAYFLHFIVHTIQQALQGHPELDPDRFGRWAAERHSQIERGELVYIAHQLDFTGKRQARNQLREPSSSK